MKKFLFMFLIVASIVGAATFAFAGDDDMDGEKKFTIHGEVRQRADFSDNLRDFSEDEDDSALFFPYRARVAAEGHFMKNVVGYVEFQAFGEWGEDHASQAGSDLPFNGDNESNNTFRGRSAFQQMPTGDADVDLYQAFIGLNEIGESNFSLKFGRQEIVRGTEMLLGDLDFYNGLVHDGAMGSWDWDGFALDVWGTRASQSMNGLGSTVFDQGNDNPDHQSAHFWGAWAQWDEWDNGADAAAYVLYYEDGRNDLAGLPDPARRSFYTLGGRTGRDLHGEDGITWNAELAIQTGDQNNGPDRGDNEDISASAFEGEIGYAWEAGADHMVYIGVAAATGDEDSADEDAEAFDPLFQDFHGRYGQADLFRFTNLQVISLGYNVTMDAHSFGGDIYSFTSAEDYTLTTGETEDDLGSEIDLWWKFQYSHNTQITVAAAFVKTGDIVEDQVENVNGLSADDGLRLIGNLRLRF